MMNRIYILKVIVIEVSTYVKYKYKIYIINIVMPRINKRLEAYYAYAKLANKFKQPLIKFIGSTTEQFIKANEAFNNKVFDKFNNVISEKVVNKFKRISYTVKDNKLVNPKSATIYKPADINTMYKNIGKSKTAILTWNQNGVTKRKAINFNSTKDLSNQLKASREVLYDAFDTEIVLLNARAARHGPLKDGQLNCVITLIENHVKVNKIPCTIDFNKVYEEFKYGVFEEDMSNLSKQFKFPIKYTDEEGTILYNESTSNNYKYLNIVGHANHVTAQVNEKKKTKYINIMNDIDIDTTDDTVFGLEAFMLKTIPLNEIINIIKVDNMIAHIKTINTAYQLKYYNTLDLEELDCITPNQYYYKKSFDFFSNRPHNIKANNPNLDAINKIRYGCITWSKDFTYSPAMHAIIDINCAFNNFGVLPRDISYYYSTKEMKPSQINNLIKNHEGFGLIDTIDFEDFSIGGWQSMPVIRELQTNYTVNVHEFMIASETTTFDIKGFMNLDYYEKRRFHNLIGSFQSNTKKETFYTTDPCKGGILTNYKQDDMTLYETYSETNHIGNKYYPHISGYVHGYTNVKMIRKYLELKKVGVKVLRMWVDGIYTYKSKKIKIDSSWKFDTKNNTPMLMECSNPIRDVNLTKMSTKLNINKDQYIAYIGQAGSGKSHKLKEIYDQNPSESIILVPSHLLRLNYINAGYENCFTYQKFVKRCKSERNWSQYSIILIDEYTSVSMKDFMLILDIASGMQKCYAFGDDAQLQNFKDKPMTLGNFTINKLKKNYRQKCRVFQNNLKEKTRQTGDISYIKNRMTTKDAINSGTLVLCAKNNEIDRVNQIGFDMNNEPNQYGFKCESPITFIDTVKKCYNGETGIISEITKDMITINKNGQDINLTHEQAHKYIKLNYACTYHRIQGQTIANAKIVINTKDLFEKKRMLYVAASRATTLNQLYILIE